MKKIFSIVLVLTLMIASLVGCGGSSKHFSGEWKFSKITKVEFVPVLPEGMLDLLKQEYNAEDEDGIINNAFDRFVADETFSNLYIKFDGKQTYTYDPFMDREATWVFYQTSENEGFISFYAELDINDGNPDPIVCPEISYNPDSNTVYIVLNAYGSFMITIELTR